MTYLCQSRPCRSASRPLSALVVFLAAFLATSFVSRTAQAQLAGKGEIKGTVTDPTGAVVPNAVIVATSTTRGTRSSVKSGNAGEYTISPLDADIYTITITAPGFQTVTQNDLHVNSLEVTDVPVSMPIGSSSENVTVSSAPPAIEGSNATLGGTLEQETYSQLPIQMGAYGQDGARRATDFVALLPGVQFNETNGNATTNTGVVNGGGARGAVSDVYINGTPFISAAGQGDPRFVWSAISVDAINQLQVQTVGYSAMYEGQGVQNYTVKGGSNSFHGSAYEYFRNTALDTFAYFDKATAAIDPLKGKLVKPAEHQNEYGGTLGGPVLRNKAFFFANFNKYNLSRGPKHIFETIPTAAQRAGDFSAVTQTDGVTRVPIYDYTACPNGPNPTSTTNCQRTAFPNGVIPSSRFAPQSVAMQSFLPATSNNQQINNYLSGYNSGLSNWTATARFDYTINQHHSVSLVFGDGSQSTTGPSRQTSLSASNNALPAPYISVQQFNPKTKIGMIEETWVVSPRAVNQLKYGFARYQGSGFNQSYLPQYAASSAIGISGLPAGQAAGAFPKVTFTGTAAPNQWAGYTDNSQATNAYTLLDNFSLSLGKHSVTAGVQISWLQYNFIAQSGGSTPLALTYTNAQTGCYAETTTATKVTSTTTCYSGKTGTTASTTIVATSGLPYASFLLGAVNAASFTSTTVVETGARFRPISPYIQDDWKISPKLTVNIGLRWDYYPPFREVKNRLSFLDPNATNPITGNKGALAFAGSSSGNSAFCNCNTNVQTWMKNFGPRLGLAYSVTPRTVIRASYGVIFAHGNGTGGSAISRQGSGLLGYAANPSFSQLTGSLPAFQIQNGIPAYTGAPFLNAGYGTGYYTGGPTPQTITFGDPYNGDRAPEFLNWSFGLQQAFTNSMTLTATYVGSQGHFLQADSNNARGAVINQLDPKYLALGPAILGAKATPANLALAGAALPYANFDQSQTVAKALAPLPQYNGISDAYGAVANSNYHALQASLNQRFASGMSFMINYTWAKNIDDGGTFRSGYALPASTTTNGQAYSANRIDRSLSLADRRHNLVATGVFESPFGTRIFSNSVWARRLAGGYRLSTIFTAFTGAPIAITSNTANTNPSQSQAQPSYNANYSGNGRINGKYGDNITSDTAGKVSYFDSNAFTATPDYKFSVLPRTAPYGLKGPGNYNLDLSLRRSFALPRAEGLKLTLEGDLYNATNHTQFSAPNGAFGNASFGTVTSTANTSRDAQLAARFEF